MADKDWQTFTFESHYPDDDGGTRADMVVAPDRDTARRLAAKQTLDDNEWTLKGMGCKSLLDFYDGDYYSPGEKMDVEAEWGDLNGSACPNCTSHGGRPNGNHVELDGATREIRECSACGYEWIPMGFGLKRQLIIEATEEQIMLLDDYERKSLLGEDEEEDEDASA